MKKIEFIDLKTQYLNYKSEIDAAMDEVLHDCNFILGHQVEQLEHALADFAGTKYCVTAANGTDSLLIALMALGIGRGDEVITVPFTWVSTASVILRVGAVPVFIDIDPETFNMDTTLIENAITEKTKAIIPVSLFGQMPNFGEIGRIAKKYDLVVIEDGAQSFGASQNAMKSCGASLIGSTSFYPAKPLGCYGEGGALFTSDDQLADRMRAIRVHGSEKKHTHSYVGLNGRLDTLQAAILLIKLKHYQNELEKRKEIGFRYTDQLKGYCCVPYTAPGNTHVYAQYTIRIKERECVAEELKKLGIPTGVYYPKCLHEQPIFTELNYAQGSFPHAELASKEVLSLPMHPWLTYQEQEYIIESVKKVIESLCHTAANL